MTRRSLLFLLAAALLYVATFLLLRPYFRGIPVLGQSISVLYLWVPGIIALIFARMERIRLPVFARPNRYFFSIPLLTMAICLIAFLVAIPFGMAETPNPVFEGQSILKMLGYGGLFLLTSYLFVAILFGLIFLGGELYWRGYLLEKLRKKGLFRCIWLTALFWSLWQIPIMALAYSPGLPNLGVNVLWTFAFNFSMAPVLTYFRLKGQSVLTAAVFYSSLVASFLYFMVLFPTMKGSVIGVYGGCVLVGLIVFSALWRLYSPKTWEKIS